MYSYLKLPGLPENSVSRILISGEFPIYHQFFHDNNIEVIQTQRMPSLQKPVSYHPDMQFCDLGGGIIFVLKGSSGYYEDKMSGSCIFETQKYAQPAYPRDVICNCIRIGKYFFGKLDAVDPGILGFADSLGLTLVNISQGYTACSCCAVNENALITADSSIAKAANQAGLDVLKIKPGSIHLRGYDTGFIGGCTGKISHNTMVFTGSLDLHPSGKEIKHFLLKHNIKYIELTSEMMADIGGIIPISES